MILAPLRRDAPTIAHILQQAGLVGEICATLTALRDAIDEGAGAALIAEEALGREQHLLRNCLERQPPWSDLPIVLVAGPTAGRMRPDWAISRFAELGNVMLLERPLHSATLVTTLRSALRARRRQYQVREHLVEREQSEAQLRAQEAELRRLNENLEQRVEERSRALEAEIAERRKAEAALQQAQRLEAIGQLTGGVAHDFNNLLCAVLGNLDLLEAQSDDSEFARRLIRGAVRAAERGAKLTQQLLAFSRKQHLRLEPVDINAAVAGMGDLLTRTIGGTIRLQTTLQPELWPALADPSQIELVILNLAINARDAMPSGGTLTIETANVPSGEQESELPPGDFIRITVRDTGSGMSEEVLAKVFEPFFTTKDIGKGTGLGLPQVHGVVKQSGGDVRMRSRLGEGTTVDVYLPRTHGIPRSAGTEMARPALSRSRATILLVDDDPDVRDFVANALAQLGYDVQVANGARAALDLMDARDRCATVDLLLADFAMPELTGAELARAARARRPDLPIVFISGYSEQNLSGQLDGADGLVKKPFKLVELARVIERALERRRPGHSSTSGNVVPLRGSRDA